MEPRDSLVFGVRLVGRSNQNLGHQNRSLHHHSRRPPRRHLRTRCTPRAAVRVRVLFQRQLDSVLELGGTHHQLQDPEHPEVPRQRTRRRRRRGHGRRPNEKQRRVGSGPVAQKQNVRIEEQENIRVCRVRRQQDFARTNDGNIRLLFAARRPERVLGHDERHHQELAGQSAPPSAPHFRHFVGRRVARDRAHEVEEPEVEGQFRQIKKTASAREPSST